MKFLIIRPVCRDLYTTCARMFIVRSEVPLRQPEDGQYMPKHVVVHNRVIKYTPCNTAVFDCIQFSKFHTTNNGDDSLPTRDGYNPPSYSIGRHVFLSKNLSDLSGGAVKLLTLVTIDYVYFNP